MRSTWSPVGWMCALLLWGAIGHANGRPVPEDTDIMLDKEGTPFLSFDIKAAFIGNAKKDLGSVFDDIEEGVAAFIGDGKKDLAIQHANYRPSMEVGKPLFDNAEEMSKGDISNKGAIAYPYGPPLTGGNDELIGY